MLRWRVNRVDLQLWENIIDVLFKRREFSDIIISRHIKILIWRVLRTDKYRLVFPR